MRPQNPLVVRTTEEPASSIAARMGDMRTWLNRNRIELSHFELVTVSPGKVAFDAQVSRFGARRSLSRCVRCIDTRSSVAGFFLAVSLGRVINKLTCTSTQARSGVGAETDGRTFSTTRGRGVKPWRKAPDDDCKAV
jgi:hypothetical protein